MLGAIVEDIAAHLPDFAPVPRDEPHSAARLRAEDGRELVLRFDGTTDRVVIHGVWPRAWTKAYTGSYPKIGLGTAKGGAAMARDITRRLLPGYAEDFARAKGLAQAAEQDRQDRDALAAELAALAGCTVSPAHPAEFRWLPAGPGYGECEVRGGVTFKLRSLTPAQARRVAAVIREITLGDS